MAHIHHLDIVPAIEPVHVFADNGGNVCIPFSRRPSHYTIGSQHIHRGRTGSEPGKVAQLAAHFPTARGLNWLMLQSAFDHIAPVDLISLIIINN